MTVEQLESQIQRIATTQLHAINDPGDPGDPDELLLAVKAAAVRIAVPLGPNLCDADGQRLADQIVRGSLLESLCEAIGLAGAHELN